MKKILSIVFAFMLMVFLSAQASAELNNVTCRGEDGNLVCYDASMNEIYTVDATNRLLSIPSGSAIDVESGGYFKIAGTAVTATAAKLNMIPADGNAGEYLTTDGSGAWSWAAGTSGDLDDAYNSGATITVDAGALQLNGSHASNDTFFVNKTAGTGDAIQVTNAGDGYDINGTGGSWYITKAGVATFSSFGPLTSGLTISGGAINLNASSNNAVNVGTGTTTSTVSIGGGSNSVGISTSSWDITTAGALSGITTLGMSSDLTLSAGDIYLASGKALKSSATTAETLKIQAYDVDNTTYRDVLTLTNGNTIAAAIGSGNETVAVNSSDWDIDATGVMTGIGAITADGLFTGSAGATITGGVVNLNASSNNAVNIGTGTTTSTVTIGGAGNQSIDIGNGAAVKTVTLGSSNTTSTTTINAGTGDMTITSVDDLTINGGSAGSIITVGGNTQGNVINIGADDTTADTIGIGSAKDTSSLAGIAVTVGSTGTTSATGIQSGSGGVNVNASINQPTNIGTGTSTGTVTIGNTTPAIVNVLGTVTVNADAAALATNIGTGTTTGTVTIGGAGAQSIAIGNGAAAKTVTLGSTNTTSTTTINAGSGNINLVGTLATGDAITGDGTAALGGFLKTVTDDTDAHSVLVGESGTVLTNAGASGPAAHTLPAAAAGLNYCFVVMAVQELRVTPAAGDKIVHGSTVMDAAEYYFADAIGETLCITAVDSTNWVMTSSTGTWAEQTP